MIFSHDYNKSKIVDDDDDDDNGKLGDTFLNVEKLLIRVIQSERVNKDDSLIGHMQ